MKWTFRVTLTRGARRLRASRWDQPWHQRDFTVFDPDGNAITFFTRR